MLDTADSTQSDAPVLIVTGASAGIGRALALAAAREHYRLVISARRSERLEQVAAQIRGEGGSCVTVVGDVREAHVPQRLVDAAIASYGRINAIANIAGMGAPGPLLDQSDAAVEAQWQVHVAAPLRIARAALPHLRATHGQLLFIGSGLARVPAPNFGAYAAAKAAIRAVAMQLRRELHAEGIGVMYVDPGAVATEFSEAAGMKQRAPSALLAGADAVARRILHGLKRRSARVNAVPYQTAGVLLGEWFPGLADRAMAHITAVPDPAPPIEAPKPPPLVFVHSAPDANDLERALEPVSRRMERVKLSREFICSLLVPDTTITLGDAAMRWAGMPNKNERAAMHAVLEALTTAGFLEAVDSERWLVRRGFV
jgi:short-subunit dehydrogenase